MFDRLSRFIARFFRKHPASLAELEGKIVLAGLSFLDEEGAVAERFQLYGRVIRASRHEGVVLAKGDGTGEFILPPYPLQSYRRAASGEYTIKSSGARIMDPDFTTAWLIDGPPDGWPETRLHGMQGGFEPVSGTD
ncbi:hypothetical protein [Henriciella sp.]|mgnify:CR=1 FL=1|uniref:hypothetical protein n=1 Tax=Henriciella sp. TaxID=1968823 RepID=UPI00262DB893|nr:hypothetical protein [Henriciella sp.]